MTSVTTWRMTCASPPTSARRPRQLAFFDPAALRRAERRYPEALHRRPTATGTVLSVLAGGSAAPAPVVALRKAA